jgi:hypothetical protein
VAFFSLSSNFGCVAKKIKLIKMRHMNTVSEAFIKKSGTPFARFAMIRFSNTYHFNELKIFCNITSRSTMKAMVSLSEQRQTFLQRLAALNDLMQVAS